MASLNPSELGLQFEKLCIEMLNNIQCSEVLNEKELKSRYGNDKSGIDIIAKMQNCIVYIQCKWIKLNIYNSLRNYKQTTVLQCSVD
jgi:hypothetical protein